jgi:16S rRNA (cytidine1402-2'-O)-methyltransferase
LLYIIATPIGNLEDISFRAVRVLKEVDLILAEDTRHSKKLLEHYSIDAKVMAFHEHNEKHKSTGIVEKLQTQNIALISDAGTPLISDPGFNLVRLAKENGIEVSPIPGSSSVITALSAAGLPSDKFCFLGFVPTKTTVKQNFINEINLSDATSICFESPKRILDLITLMSETFDKNRQITIAKELTKKFETIITGNPEKILNYLTSEKEHQNGEFVVLIEGNKNANDSEKLLGKILPILSKELPSSTAAKIAAKITGLNKKYCYEKLL